MVPRCACTISRIEKEDPKTVFLIGGTCASEIAPVPFLNRKYRGDLAVLWLDAHGDLNTPQSSLSKHFHGMPLRILLGDGPKEIDALVFSHLLRSQVVLAGSRDLDPPEVAYAREREIACISISALTKGNALGLAIRKTGSDNLYIPTPGGIEFDHLVEVLKELRDEFTVVGSSILEYVPVGKGDPDRMQRLVEILRRPGVS